MYIPPAFREDDPAALRTIMRTARLATLVTATPDGPIATPLPLLLDETEGAWGVVYGHVARANPQWRLPVIGEALALFSGPEAYVTPSWYAAKAEHGKVAPTWNYVAVHAYGPVEFFEDPDRLQEVVTRLTDLRELSLPGVAIFEGKHQPPAMAGTMLSSSPSFSSVFRPSRKRMSSSPR